MAGASVNLDVGVCSRPIGGVKGERGVFTEPVGGGKDDLKEERCNKEAGTKRQAVPGGVTSNGKMNGRGEARTNGGLGGVVNEGFDSQEVTQRSRLEEIKQAVNR